MVDYCEQIKEAEARYSGDPTRRSAGLVGGLVPPGRTRPSLPRLRTRDVQPPRGRW